MTLQSLSFFLLTVSVDHLTKKPSGFIWNKSRPANTCPLRRAQCRGCFAKTIFSHAAGGLCDKDGFFRDAHVSFQINVLVANLAKERLFGQG